MKKLFICIALVLTAVFSLTGCGSCAGGTATISYSNTWSANAPETAGLSETLSYSVKHVDNITIGSTELANTLSKEKIDFSYGEGRYTTTLKIVHASQSLLNGVESEVLNELLAGGDTTVKRVYYYHTRLDLPFTYKYGDMTAPETVNDYIETTTYFLLAGHSLAPIYSENKTFVSFVITDTEDMVQRQNYETTTVYNKKTVTTDTKVYYPIDVDGHLAGELADQKTSTSKYTFKSVLENSSLLFALRCLNLGGESSGAISVYSHVYTTPKTLTVSSIDPAAEKFTINLNGVSMPEEEIQLKGYSFVLNTASGCSASPNTGRAQYVYFNKAMDNAPASIGSNRTIVMRYVEPLIEYSMYSSMGALVYSLDSITF